MGARDAPGPARHAELLPLLRVAVGFFFRLVSTDHRVKLVVTIIGSVIRRKKASRAERPKALISNDDSQKTPREVRIKEIGARRGKKKPHKINDRDASDTTRLTEFLR